MKKKDVIKNAEDAKDAMNENNFELVKDLSLKIDR